MSEKTIQERLAVIEEIVLRMEQRLFGNGHAGELETLRSRIQRLEAWMWRAAGAIGLAFALVEVLHR